jgi:hypothetical protein
MVEYNCEICGKNFGNQKSHYITHTNKKFPCKSNKQDNNQVQICTFINNNVNDDKFPDINEKKSDDKDKKIIIKKFKCEFCNSCFTRNASLLRHLEGGYCRVQKQNDIQKNNTDNNFIVNVNDDKLNLILKQNDELKNQIFKLTINQLPKKSEFTKINKNIKKLEDNIPAKSSQLINNQLINVIIDKDKKLEELDNINKKFYEDNQIDLFDNDIKKSKNKIIICDDTINELENKPINLILNNQIIQFRETDNYINATQLCKAGGKKLSHWINLENTKELISELASDAGIPASLLIDSKKGYSNNFIQGTWIHPDLAIQLAQWINSKFAIQVSKWIRELFTKGNVSVNLQILKEKENIIKDCEKRIKILENLTLKRHKRIKYPESNVVYIITDKNNKKDRKFVIGSTIDLTDRLTQYNKDSEHEVIYYKGFESEEVMLLAEKMVLSKLDQYREQANRDRIILPIGEDIKLFTNIIDNACKFFN